MQEKPADLSDNPAAYDAYDSGERAYHKNFRLVRDAPTPIGTGMGTMVWKAGWRDAYARDKGLPWRFGRALGLCDD